MLPKRPEPKGLEIPAAEPKLGSVPKEGAEPKPGAPPNVGAAPNDGPVRPPNPTDCPRPGNEGLLSGGYWLGLEKRPPLDGNAGGEAVLVAAEKIPEEVVVGWNSEDDDVVCNELTVEGIKLLVTLEGAEV